MTRTPFVASATLAASLLLASHLAVLAGHAQAAPPAPSGDPIRGKQVFEKRCIGCHTLAQNREGPQLRTVYGRTAGTAPAFEYSTALKHSHIVWNAASLDRWLSNPDSFVPGNNMDFHLPRPQERIDVIRYLQQSAASPPPATPQR